MRTWSGLVEMVIDGDVRARVHADLAAEHRGDEHVWWGQLRGAAGCDLNHDHGVVLRFPDGRDCPVARAAVDTHDPYHRIEVTGLGPPPF